MHVVSAEEAATGKYNIEDVVLPLPGTNISLPKHDTAQVHISQQYVMLPEATLHHRCQVCSGAGVGPSDQALSTGNTLILVGKLAGLLHRDRLRRTDWLTVTEGISMKASSCSECKAGVLESLEPGLARVGLDF